MTAIENKTSRLFKVAWESDDDLGYPNHVSFVAGDQEWAESTIATQLTEGTATVVVGADSELLLIPERPGPVDRLLRRVPVTVSVRIDGRPTPYAARTRLGRHPLAEMSGLAGQAKARSERRGPSRKARKQRERLRRESECRPA